MNRFVNFFIILFVVTFPLLAIGQPCSPVELNITQEASRQEWWMVFLNSLVTLSSPLITAIIGVLGTWLVRKIGKKWDAEKLETLMRLKDGLVATGVAFAEEQAHKALKAGEEKTESAKKMAIATDYIQAQLEQSGIGRLAENELIRLVEAKLNGGR